jgi:predicted DNA-binding protein (MmcQ/YjbR family)
VPPSPIVKLRALCLALPEAHEVIAWGEPTFRIRNKMFATFASPTNHHGGGRPAVWIKASPANQQLMIDADPSRYFSPPYVGPSGWIGVWLDAKPDWSEVAALLRDGYRAIAPKKLAAALLD